MVGLGGICSPIGTWSQTSSFSVGELEMDKARQCLCPSDSGANIQVISIYWWSDDHLHTGWSACWIDIIHLPDILCQSICKSNICYNVSCTIHHISLWTSVILAISVIWSSQSVLLSCSVLQSKLAMETRLDCVVKWETSLDPFSVYSPLPERPRLSLRTIIVINQYWGLYAIYRFINRIQT